MRDKEKAKFELVYVYDNSSNTNVPNRIGQRLSKFDDVTFSAISLFPLGKFLRKIMLIFRADLVHTHHTKSALVVSILKPLVKMIKTKTFIRVHTAHRDISTLGKVSIACYRNLIFPVSDFVICNSNATRVAVGKLKNDLRLQTIYNGVDTDRFRLKRTSVNQSLRLISVGRLIPIKNHKLLVEALDRCINNGLELNLVIVGDGPCRDSLEHFIKRNNLEKFITLVGEAQYSEIPGYLQKADIYVASSFSEGFGNATIEAALSGLKVLASNIPVHREISGGHFDLFDPFSIDSITECITAACQSINQDEIIQSSSYFKCFSEKICAQHHYQAYRELIDENTP